MRGRILLGSWLVCSLVACGSSTPKPDASVDRRPDAGLPSADAGKPLDTDTAQTTDTARVPDAGRVDSARVDTAVDAPLSDAGKPDMPLSDAGKPDAPLSDAGPVDALPPDAYDPGPAIPIVVNSGNTASYSLADGEWTRFRFAAEAGQIYSIAELSSVTTGYLGSDSAVSPAHFTQQTNSAGVLVFTAPATQTYYLAVAAAGGGASGAFQIADGGKPVALGASTITLTAPNRDDTAFFRFPIAAGKAYQISLGGPTTSSVGLGLSPKAERAANGQFSAPLRGVSGPLPMVENIPATSVALSYSGFYYFFLHVYDPMTLTLSLTETSQ